MTKLAMRPAIRTGLKPKIPKDTPGIFKEKNFRTMI